MSTHLSAEARATIREALYAALDEVTIQYQHAIPEYRARWVTEDKAPILAAIAELEAMPLPAAPRCDGETGT